MRNKTLFSLALIVGYATLAACAVRGSTSSDLYKRMTLAIANNQLDTVRECIHAGVPLNTHEPRTGNTPLIEAAIHGRQEIIGLLIANGAELEASDNKGHTALLCAVSQTHREALRTLITEGSDLNAQNNNKITALMNAVTYEWSQQDDNPTPSVAQLLLQCGAIPLTQGQSQWIEQMLRTRFLFFSLNRFRAQRTQFASMQAKISAERREAITQFLQYVASHDGISQDVQRLICQMGAVPECQISLQ